MKIGSLFSGYGGLDMGVQAVLGGEVAWHVEFDQAPSKILERHWPDVPNYGDITKVDFAAVDPVDVITGGFPCQDLSLAGRRAGMRPGTRSGLWADFLRAIATIRPRLAVIENVRGLLSGCAESDLEPCPGCLGDGEHRPPLRALGRVLGDLADIGYDAEWIGLRASDAGAPHSRFRVFVLAYPADHGHEWAGITRARRAGSAHGRSALAYTDGGQYFASITRPDQRAVPGSDGSGTGPHEWGPYRGAIERWQRVTGRVAPAATRSDGRNGSLRLSAAFVEWMMGLPSGHVSSVGITRAQQLKALGNGVVPQQAALALRLLLSHSNVPTPTLDGVGTPE